MSRGFVKEEDQEETPLVPPRADLPLGVSNYVTAKGLEELKAERLVLLAERAELKAATEQEKRIASNFMTAMIHLIDERISTAKLVDLSEQPKDEVRFGASVTLKIETFHRVSSKSGKPQTYQLVGVDEADISKNKISFVSPIAKILLGKKVGERAVLKLVNEDRHFEVLEIRYD